MSEKQEYISTIPGMPKELAGAVNDVMSGIKKLGKGERNKFDNYNFASIDNFLEMLNPLCADAGLIILQDELNCDMVEGKPNAKGETKPWLSIQFGFTLAHKSGATWPAGRRTVMVPANGAQAFGSAQSYALKQFSRATFLIATGDQDDADLQKSEELPVRKTKANARDDWAQMEKEIRAHTDPKELAAWGAANSERMHELPLEWLGKAREEYARHLKAITPVEEAAE